MPEAEVMPEMGRAVLAAVAVVVIVLDTAETGKREQLIPAAAAVADHHFIRQHLMRADQAVRAWSLSDISSRIKGFKWHISLN